MEDSVRLSQEAVRALHENYQKRVANNPPVPHRFSEKHDALFAEAASLRQEPADVLAVFNGEERIYIRTPRETKVSYIRPMIENALKGYEITDYKNGYATDGKNTYRIGKLLKEYPELLKRYMEDESRAGDLMIVISRNPVDIARMAGGRGWMSCMTIHDNSTTADDVAKKVASQIQHGALIAYLVSEKDPDITNPLARVMIRPFCTETKRDLYFNGEDVWNSWRRKHPARSAFGRAACRIADLVTGKHETKREYIYTADIIYGLGNSSFEKTVTQFIETELNRDKKGNFRAHENIYKGYLGEHAQRRHGKTVTYTNTGAIVVPR